MTVTCDKTSKLACAGSILLQTTTKPALKLGQKTFSVKKGKKATVTIVVAKDVRALIEELRTIKVKVVVFVKTNNEEARSGSSRARSRCGCRRPRRRRAGRSASPPRAGARGAGSRRLHFFAVPR